MRLRSRLRPLPRQVSDGRINHHRLNLMSNPRRVKSPPIIYISNPLRASAWKKGVNMIVISIENYRQGGGLAL